MYIDIVEVTGGFIFPVITDLLVIRRRFENVGQARLSNICRYMAGGDLFLSSLQPARLSLFLVNVLAALALSSSGSVADLSISPSSSRSPFPSFFQWASHATTARQARVGIATMAGGEMHARHRRCCCFKGCAYYPVCNYT